MKIVRFEIKDHSDRMGMILALHSNGYNYKIERDTSYELPKIFVLVEVNDDEVKEKCVTDVKS